MRLYGRTTGNYNVKMTSYGGPPFGIDQLIINRDFVPAPFGWDQGDGFDFRLEFIQQISYQTGSARGVVSDGAVLNGYF